MVDINKVTLKEKEYLKFDFPKHLDIHTAENAIIKWNKEVAHTEQKVNLIFNCTSMSGFDTEARRKWQSTLKQLKSKTGDIWIVSDNMFILGAARTMGILSGYQIKTTRSIDQIG